MMGVPLSLLHRQCGSCHIALSSSVLSVVLLERLLQTLQLVSLFHYGLQHVPSPLYEPLSPGQIRLITIEAAEELSDPIHCQLRAYDGKALPSYTALSYVWGDAATTAPVMINGIEVEKTVNLCAALRRIRALEDTHYWIDAVCIDQANDAEKSEQVARMGHIYSSATMVVAWLGESTSTSGDALKFLAEWTMAKIYLDYVSKNSVPSGSVEEAYLHAQTRKSLVPGAVAFIKDPYRLSRWKGLSELLLRPYWRRIWIIQELNLAGSVKLLCGETSCDFHSFRPMLSLQDEADRLRVWSHYGLYQIEYLRPSIAVIIGSSLATLAVHPHNSLCDVVRKALFSFATDPRDKVYALLALVPPRNRRVIKTDYTRGVVEVYTDFVLSVIVSTGRLSTFHSISCHKSETTRSLFPSWVPDLQFSTRIPMRNMEPWASQRCDAASKQPAVWAISADRKQLSVQGVRYSQLTSVVVGAEEMHRHPDHHAVAETLIRWYEHAQHLTLKDTYPGFDLPEIFFRTLVRDESNAGPPDYLSRYISTASYAIPRYQEWVSAYAAWRIAIRQILSQHYYEKLPQLGARGSMTRPTSSLIAQGRDSGRESTAAELRSCDVLRWLHRLVAISCFFLTSDGHMGNGPMEAESGDVVCVLMGSDMPMILRPCGQHFTLIGPCYVFGIMYGQVVKEAQEGKRKFEMFDLR